MITPIKSRIKASSGAVGVGIPRLLGPTPHIQDPRHRKRSSGTSSIFLARPATGAQMGPSPGGPLLEADMSVDYKYFIREFSDKEALRVFIEDEMNRPDSLDELVSVITEPSGLLVAVGRSRRQARGGDARFERGMTGQ